MKTIEEIEEEVAQQQQSSLGANDKIAHIMREKNEGNDFLSPKSIAAMNNEEIQAIFNPEGTLSAVEVQRNVASYVHERNKIAFEQHELRPVVMREGRDGATGLRRMIGPGETVQDGLIVCVNPEFAARAAEKMRNISGEDARQSLRRNQAMKELVTIVLNRVQEPIGARYVSFDEARQLTNEYDEAMAKGYPESTLDFLPMRAYLPKFEDYLRRFGKQLRPLLENEVGIFQMGSNPSSPLAGSIVCTRDKQWTNHHMSVSVPSNYKTETDQSSTVVVRFGEQQTKDQQPLASQALKPQAKPPFRF